MRKYILANFFPEDEHLSLNEIISRRRLADLETASGAAVALQNAAESIAMATVPLDSPERIPRAMLIESGSEALQENFPIVDSQASINMAVWSGVPVNLNHLYKPFLTSIKAESGDELRALRDIAFVQQELNQLHKTCESLRDQQTVLQEKLASPDITVKDHRNAQACKLIFTYFGRSLQIQNCSNFKI